MYSNHKFPYLILYLLSHDLNTCQTNSKKQQNQTDEIQIFLTANSYNLVWFLNSDYKKMTKMISKMLN
jgi:hypothetical protein